MNAELVTLRLVKPSNSRYSSPQLTYSQEKRLYQQVSCWIPLTTRAPIAQLTLMKNLHQMWRIFVRLSTACCFQDRFLQRIWINIHADIELATLLPKWQRWPRCTWLPVASVDVERSFSKYGSVPSPLRCSLATDSIKSYCSVFFNNSLRRARKNKPFHVTEMSGNSFLRMKDLCS